jgi:hypothetical protein
MKSATWSIDQGRSLRVRHLRREQVLGGILWLALLIVILRIAA